MLKFEGGYLLSASDLTAHLACAHRTNLDRALADGAIAAPPVYSDPMLEALKERGRRHEAAYVERLQKSGLTIARIEGVGITTEGVSQTHAAMKAGVDIVVQGALRAGRWSGRPDILRKVDKPSALGAWSYGVLDTKLARETTGATVLQLCLYADLLALTQGAKPEHAYVVTPGEDGAREEAFRLDAYGAFYRRVKRELETNLEAPPGASYPEPVAACDICRWFSTCDDKRRADDHPSFVAGLGRVHVNELREQNLPTLTAFAEAASPFAWKPKRGAVATYEQLQLQARVQLKGRRHDAPVHELIEHRDGLGLARLPEPSDGDIFLDFEGDPFVGTAGLEYLLGYVYKDEAGALVYKALWALSATDEKSAFETFIDFVLERQKQHPGLHIYHYAPYEPAALKRLMGRYATREEELDGLLRSERFVDLLSVVRNGVRASVESYSIKKLEPFYSFERKAALLDANRSLARVQAALELGQSLDELGGDLEVVERYNEDDCRSTEALRNWLEELRGDLIAQGAPVTRPVPKDAEASEKVTQRLAAERALAERLAADVPIDPAERDEDQQARWLLAQTLGWHRREDKASWHEHFRLAALSPEELLDERCALSGLEYEKEIEAGQAPVQRYRFPPQETELREGDGVRAWGGAPFATVRAISAAENWIDLKKRKDTAQTHVSAIYEYDHVDSDIIADALMRIGADVADHGLAGAAKYGAARDLLLRRAPQPRSGTLVAAGETPSQSAVRVIGELSAGVLPIQGPPGAGKTYTGAQMIAALVKAGKRVGVTATSHKVIVHLLEKAIEAGGKNGVAMTCVHKGNDEVIATHTRLVIDKKPTRKVLDRLGVDAEVLGGTAWFWSDPDAEGVLDVLFVDEAAQMSLANVLAVSQAAKTIVLLGDPRQLEQPSKGSHPEGAEVSALDHILMGAPTIGDTQGLFLAETWRLHDEICGFTSEMFYERRLKPLAGLKQQRIIGAGRLDGAGLRYLPVSHVGNQNSSIEEVAAIKALVEQTLAGSPTWIDREGVKTPLTLEHILIVAPYNAQVFALKHAVPNARIGTVDKFQGQEAPIVIYSMTSSSSADAPRGMEFLYSLNRLNVATSRAKAICVLVGSPALFEAECRTPRQMELANALCRYKEMADEIPSNLT